MDSLKQLSEDLTKILQTAVSNRTYGSVEIYFEDGRITQVTQRIIRKIGNKIEKKNGISKNSRLSSPSSAKSPSQ